MASTALIDPLLQGGHGRAAQAAALRPRAVPAPPAVPRPVAEIVAVQRAGEPLTGPGVDEARPDLTLVPPRRLHPAVRRRRFAATVMFFATLTLLALLAVAVFQAMLVQQQRNIDRLHRAVAEEHARNEKLRFEAARLASPSRILGAAEERLGMVQPETMIFMTPSAETAIDVAIAVDAVTGSTSEP